MEEKDKKDIKDMQNMVGMLMPQKKEEKNFFDDISSMERMKQKAKIYNDAKFIFSDVAKNDAVYEKDGKYGRKFKKITLKQAIKDYKQGIAHVNRCVPLVIDFPIDYYNEQK